MGDVDCMVVYQLAPRLLKGLSDLVRPTGNMAGIVSKPFSNGGQSGSYFR
jgi:hypothetical protein